MLVWKEQRSLCLCSSLTALFHAGYIIAHILPHPLCHLRMNTAFQWLSFTDKSHECKPYPEYVGKCEGSFIFQLSQIYHSKLHNLHVANQIFTIWNSFSHNHHIPRMWPLSMLTTGWSSTHRYQWGAQTKSPWGKEEEWSHSHKEGSSLVHMA